MLATSALLSDFEKEGVDFTKDESAKKQQKALLEKSSFEQCELARYSSAVTFLSSD